MTELLARFQVTGYDPREVDAVDDDWAGVLIMRKTFTAGLTGESVLLFVSSGPTEGHRAYLAAEQITGSTEGGAPGTLTVHHGGLESDPDSFFGYVVPDSGAGCFEGWTGSARIEHDDDGAFFRFTLTGS